MIYVPRKGTRLSIQLVMASGRVRDQSPEHWPEYSRPFQQQLELQLFADACLCEETQASDLPFIDHVATIRDTLRELIAGGKTYRDLSSGDADALLPNDPLFDYKLFGAVAMSTIAQSAQHIFRYDTALRFCAFVFYVRLLRCISPMLEKSVCKI